MKKGLVLCAVLSLGWLATAAARVAVYPQSFEAGGWSLDVQFMDVMGSPYLLAHGRGIRCLDATAVAELPEAGAWRVWVRARKWVDGAGTFRVKVNGCALEKTFGVSQSEWAWEDGGTVTLAKGTVRVALVDQDGFDGRCAGVVFTKDDAAPEGPLQVDAARVDETVDATFVVVGGGLPGVCAAVAAARRGVKTVLVQDRPVLGGNSSGEIRVWSAGEARYPLVREVRGWFMNRDGNMHLSDAHRMRLVQDEPHLTLLLCTRAFSVEKAADGSISAVKALDWKRNRIVKINGALFCDATGDGWIGYWAGADWRMGREARAEYDESFAPEKADSHTLGASLMWTSAEANTDMPFHAPWAEPYANGEKAVNGEWNWEYGIRTNVITNGEHVRDRLLLAIYGAFSRAKKEPGQARRVLNFLPFVLGKRESRRLMGDWVLSEKDITQHRPFEDAVASGSWSVDLHYDDFKEGVDFLTTCRQPHFGRYFIPYRSIYSRNVSNLFMVGRCFSCTHVGLASPRVVNTLAQLGVAAGEAVALCRKYACTPRALYTQGRYRELQDRLGGSFPGRPDPAQKDWRIVDDEMPCVTFTGVWKRIYNMNGEQEGHQSSYATKTAQAAVYPLPVEKAGRYALKMRVPYRYAVEHPSKTVLECVSGGEKRVITVDPTLEMGQWREIATLTLQPGAVLRLDAAASRGTVIADGFAIVPLP